MTVGRREFVGGALAAGALALVAPRGAQGAEAKIEVLLGEPVGTISPNIYSHFIEHLGGVIYDGIWVGENSKVPNVGGIRRALVEHVKRIKPGVMRWPGGCFADQYDWRDGVGPRDKRPRRTNFWRDATGARASAAYGQLDAGPQKYEPNWFGTNEFMAFCRQIGTRPYFAANVRSLPAQRFQEWVEYCNAPAGTTTWADTRAAGGDREPYRVEFWGVGNESWGCGGRLTPEEYSQEFRRFIAYVPRYGVDLKFIAAGPNGGDIAWTRRFFTNMVEKGFNQLNSLWGWGLHYYAGTTGQGHPLEYTTDEWYELIARADRIGTLIEQHWAVMGEMDPQHRVKIALDEWGAWHNQHASLPAGYLFGYPGTLRDALVAALSLDTFNRHADKVAMANLAQLVNCIHSLFLAHDEKFVLTPTYHVFAMYAPHQGATAVRTLCSAPNASYADSEKKPHALWGLNGSASVKDGVVTLTLTNPHATEAREAEIVVRGGTVRSAAVTTLTAAELNAHNTFERPSVVAPQESSAAVAGGVIMQRVPPASVTRVTIALG